MAGRRAFLSEAQLVVADPFAEIQQWHLDAATGRGPLVAALMGMSPCMGFLSYG